MSDLSESAYRQMGFSREYIEGLKKCLDALLLEEVAGVIRLLEEAYREGKQVFIIGNGGSAATASHMACDLGKVILPEEGNAVPRFRVTALADNVPWMTALANDLGYEYIFSEQLKNLLQKGDLVIAISGSGNSPNIVEGIRAAKSLDAKVLGILGFNGGKAGEMVDASVIVRSENYGYVEDVHMVLDHLVTAYFKTLLAKEIVAEQTDGV
jgi:D-sedoheptulose 7-phosphate isomerase